VALDAGFFVYFRQTIIPYMYRFHGTNSNAVGASDTFGFVCVHYITSYRNKSSNIQPKDCLANQCYVSIVFLIWQAIQPPADLSRDAQKMIGNLTNVEINRAAFCVG
jgi:hypothetical protein